MKNYLLLILCIWQLQIHGQDISNYDKPPVFPGCETKAIEALKPCFIQKVSQRVYDNFEVPQIVNDENYNGDIVVLFEVDAEGNFIILYVDAIYEALKSEARRVFGAFPKIRPATYNGNPTYTQYSFKIRIPLTEPGAQVIQAETNAISEIERKAKAEFDSITASIKPYEDMEFESQLNIPFTHQYYSKFDRNLNLIGTNSHTASKPYMYEDIARYYDFKAAKDALVKPNSTWGGRKLFNEHLVQLQSDAYWFTIDPILTFR